MATRLPRVTVSRIEAQLGFSAICHDCPDRVVRGTRREADRWAVAHRAGHASPDPVDQVGLLEEA